MTLMKGFTGVAEGWSRPSLTGNDIGDEVIEGVVTRSSIRGSG